MWFDAAIGTSICSAPDSPVAIEWDSGTRDGHRATSISHYRECRFYRDSLLRPRFPVCSCDAAPLGDAPEWSCPGSPESGANRGRARLEIVKVLAAATAYLGCCFCLGIRGRSGRENCGRLQRFIVRANRFRLGELDFIWKWCVAIDGVVHALLCRVLLLLERSQFSLEKRRKTHKHVVINISVSMPHIREHPIDSSFSVHTFNCVMMRWTSHSCSSRFFDIKPAFISACIWFSKLSCFFSSTVISATVSGRFGLVDDDVIGGLYLKTKK